MRILFGWVIAVSILFIASEAWSGGAVAARQSGAKTRQQQMMQKEQQRQEMLAAQNHNDKVGLRDRPIKIDRPVKVEDEVGVEEMAEALRENGKSWSLMIDSEAKEYIVMYFIEEFQGRGVQINKPPAHYAQMIDGVSEQSPDMLDRPFDQVLQVMAIIEYDFHNGTNPDVLAAQVLGSPQAVEQNKKRIGSQ